MVNEKYELNEDNSGLSVELAYKKLILCQKCNYIRQKMFELKFYVLEQLKSLKL